MKYQSAGTNPGRPLKRLLDFDMKTGTGHEAYALKRVLGVVVGGVVVVVMTTTRQTRLWAGRLGSFFRFQAGSRDFSLLLSIQTGS
jgi:hypothetical protein